MQSATSHRTSGEEEAAASATVEACAQADLAQAPACARLQHAHAMLRYMRTLACRLLDVEALLLWESEQATVGQAERQKSNDDAAEAEDEEDKCSAIATSSKGKFRHKSVQTNPTERNRMHDVIEAHKLVQVYERCHQMMLEEMRRACAACGGVGCGGEGGGARGGVPGGGAGGGAPVVPSRLRAGLRRLFRGVFARSSVQP